MYLSYFRIFQWFFRYNFLLTPLHAQEFLDFNPSGGYQLSDQCLQCLKEDFVKKRKTLAEQENDCLQQELQNVQGKLKITLDMVIDYMNAFSRVHQQSPNTKKNWQQRINFLQKSQTEFNTFIEKFCDENRQLHGVRRAAWDYYCELMDFLNIRIHHLENLVDYSALPYDELDRILTEIINGILIESLKNKALTYTENEKIDIFLRVFHFLDNPDFEKASRKILLKRLNDLYTKDNNLIALVLYQKFEVLFGKNPSKLKS